MLHFSHFLKLLCYEKNLKMYSTLISSIRLYLFYSFLTIIFFLSQAEGLFKCDKSICPRKISKLQDVEDKYRLSLLFSSDYPRHPSPKTDLLSVNIAEALLAGDAHKGLAVQAAPEHVTCSLRDQILAAELDEVLQVLRGLLLHPGWGEVPDLHADGSVGKVDCEGVDPLAEGEQRVPAVVLHQDAEGLRDERQLHLAVDGP